MRRLGVRSSSAPLSGSFWPQAWARIEAPGASSAHFLDAGVSTPGGRDDSAVHADGIQEIIITAEGKIAAASNPPHFDSILESSELFRTALSPRFQAATMSVPFGERRT